MPLDPGHARLRRFQTVLGRLVLAALLLLVPIFGMTVVGFLALDAQSERFSQVAAQAASEMRLVDGLLRGVERVDFAVGAYLETGEPGELAAVARARPRVEDSLARSRWLGGEQGELAEGATRRWVSLISRMRRAEDLWRAGRRPPASFQEEHRSDADAAASLVNSMLTTSRVEIEAEVARGRAKRAGDGWLLLAQMVLGGALALWIMRKLARDTVRPLARLGAAADRLRAGHLTERVEVGGPLELERMGETFNAMADTLAAQRDDLQRLAFTDALTGLPNRVAFLERVEAAAATGARASVLFLDLDDFKAVNDALGHGAGDALLVEVAHRITATVGDHGAVARLGGDEFAVVLDDGGPGNEVAVELTERILADLGRPLDIAGVEVVPAGSVGIAAGSEDAAALLRDADVAMYEAKRTGRHGHAAFEPAMQTAAADRLAGIADLRSALEGDQFRLVYQPLVDLPTRGLRGTEALVRWEHPSRGMVSPADFIPLAEQTGLIVGIGDWVLREACRQAATWQVSHPDPGRLMSVNLSTRQLLEAELVDQVRAALAESGLPASELMLEITESAVMADPACAIVRLGELHALGVRLAVDDFGTGHSSLAYLRELPVHELKIAREFVAEMEESPHDLALARGIMALGHGLDLRVIAEGIETEAQHDRLRGMGCDLGQGYLYSRPLEPEAIVPLLEPSDPVEESGFVLTTVPDRVYREAWSRLPDVSVITFDADLRVTSASGLGLERLGYRPGELEGLRPAEYLPADRAAQIEAVGAAALRGERHRLTWTTVRSDRVLALEVGPIRDVHGGPAGGMLVARDVTVEQGSALLLAAASS